MAAQLLSPVHLHTWALPRDLIEMAGLVHNHAATLPRTRPSVPALHKTHPLIYQILQHLHVRKGRNLLPRTKFRAILSRLRVV